MADGFSGNFTVEGECTLAEDTTVPICSVSVKDASLSWEGKRALVTGEARAELLCHGMEEGENKKHFFVKETSFPFRIEADTPFGVLPTDKKSFALLPAFTETTMQGTRVHLSCEMMLSLDAQREEKYSVPDSISKLECEKRHKDILSIHYPTDKDSLWSVGKKYGISTALLAEQNGIPLDESTAPDDAKTLDGMAWLFASEIG